MNNIISIRDAALTYQARNGEVEALGGVSFDVAEGEFVSIVGPSGCACWRDWRRWTAARCRCTASR